MSSTTSTFEELLDDLIRNRPYPFVNRFSPEEEFKELNCYKLARYLWELEASPDIGFSMERFYAVKNEWNCDSAACALGHGPFAGIGLGENNFTLTPNSEYSVSYRSFSGETEATTWQYYSNESFAPFEYSDTFYNMVLNGKWAFTDNTPKGAAFRMLMFVLGYEHVSPSQLLVSLRSFYDILRPHLSDEDMAQIKVYK